MLRGMAGAEFAPGPNRSKVLDLDGYSDCNRNDQDLDRIAEADELFDAVLTGSVDQEKNVAKKMAAAKDPSNKDKPKPATVKIQMGGTAKRKLSLYIGNFPWWTSDSDLVCLAQRLGVKDVTDIKFAENRVNGQSRGFAEMSVTSEESLKILLEKVPDCILHGETIDCRFATLQNLSIFEEKASQRVPLRLHSKDSANSETPETFPPMSHEQFPPPLPPHLPPHANVFPSIFLGQPPPFYPGVPPNIPPPLLPPHFPPPQLHALSHPPSSVHTNPAMFPPGGGGQSSISYSQQRQNHCINDADFEELMNRNRAVTSTAITKAVSSATAGEFQIATETLLTAIAIIKQSRVYEDECCQALVTSLKDCLASIQGTYCDSRSSRRSRYEERSQDRGRDREPERDRHRDREDPYGWESAGTSRRHRERSWSGDRDRIWSRSREAERHRDRHR
ncbi:cleavage and polyadenylation specificity factor subunit 7 isoform X1 [Takifugu rubripes]|uniref:Cleavage and polyadenylation specific factor 7 n=2 Tax=Takifugu rubripes TaxID=31033 RepID=H2V519_TAKRU|nr:cleavage and polyadenylation specificity factor subunit 7 isoform X1 [Takifugu rubripes]XP_056881000.1 cleavage and polyadenylation specificity factor subunit 7-like isoform X1 [Takifugu flavidus]|eukprot:XP_011608473.1 PREDICTED: cleavage and polyadenylation specificity factor subunit 7 isoform X2 [Takifugu rubripes]